MTDLERIAILFPPTRVLKPGEPFPRGEVRIRRGEVDGVIREGVDTEAFPPGT